MELNLNYWTLYFILSFSQTFVTGWSMYSLTANQKIIMEWISDIYQDTYENDEFSDRVLMIFSILQSINGVGTGV